MPPLDVAQGGTTHDTSTRGRSDQPSQRLLDDDEMLWCKSMKRKVTGWEQFEKGGKTRMAGYDTTRKSTQRGAACYQRLGVVSGEADTVAVVGTCT